MTGKHGHNSTIEHIQMESDGSQCYCGRQGCMETLLSLTSLLEENIEGFFSKVRKKEDSSLKRWNNYLTDLARAVNMLHLIYDTDFILGGYIAPYLCEEDLAFIHEKIRQMTPFTEPQDFLLISKMPKHIITIGAALPYIQEFLSDFSI